MKEILAMLTYALCRGVLRIGHDQENARIRERIGQKINHLLLHNVVTRHSEPA